MSKLWSYLSAILGLSHLSRVPDVMFKACVAAQGWPCSRNVLLAFPFCSLHMNVILPNSLVFQCVLCRFFFLCLNCTSVILSPSVFKETKEQRDHQPKSSTYVSLHAKINVSLLKRKTIVRNTRSVAAKCHEKNSLFSIACI